MSLRVWLPLNGDLHNQGLSNITVTNNGATVNTSGKIGSCYEFNNSKNISLTDYVAEFLTYTNWSISLWFKCTAQNTAHTGSALISSGNWNQATQLLQFSLGYFSSDHYTKLLITNANNWSNGYSYNFYLNTWYHVVLVSGNNKMSAYVNGELIGDSFSAYTPVSSAQSYVGIGKATYITVMPFYGLMNDVRIYDHALSALEIKEIARAKVLHYPLNHNGMGNKNLLTNDWNLTAWSKESGISVSWDDTVGMYKVLDSSHTSSRWGIYQNITLTANTTYTFSVDGMKKDQNVGFGFAEGTSWPANAGSFTTTVSRLSKTITVGSADANCRIYLNINPVSNGSNYGYFRAPKLEIGSVATPWGSHTDNTIEYDISGYCNNGTKVGTFAYSTDTPKYRVSTSFDGTTNCIQVPYNAVCPDNIFTFNLWFKKDNLGSKNYETLFGGPSGFEMDSRQNNQSTLSLYMASTRSGKRNLVTELTFNTWYMVTMVRDGIKERYYINGIFQSEIDAKPMPTGIYRIGAWGSNTGQNYYGNISDFRIYATALSAQDILSLYHNSALVDEQGIIHGAIH